jgi:hypothetical protein
VDDSGFEYTVIVRDGKYVSARAHYADGRVPEEPEQEIDQSPLQRDTIRILQDWLNRWGVLSRMAGQYEKLYVPGTFKVLGQHLYELLFPGPIGGGFDKVKNEAEKQGAPLRVVLWFEQGGDGPDDFAALPWEFLYHPPTVGSDGFFIAVETNLSLSRRIESGSNPPELPRGPLPLRILFVVSTPKSLTDVAGTLGVQVSDGQGKEYSADRNELIAFLAEYQDDASRLQVRTIVSWDPSRIRGALAGEPGYNIIHLVGVCRTTSDDVEMALPGEDGVTCWQGSRSVVDLLSNETRGRRPGLVVLHLCEARPDDYTATFERLAPKLVRAGFPAVLAMQYPLPTRDATKFTVKFYELLTAREEMIGQAVQEARRSLVHPSGDDRLFGTPVLYLQSVDGQLVRTAMISPEASTVADSFGTRPATLADRLRQAVRRFAPDEATSQYFEHWIDGADWTADRSVIQQEILTQRRDDTQQARHGPVYNEMLAIVQDSGAPR